MARAVFIGGVWKVITLITPALPPPPGGTGTFPGLAAYPSTTVYPKG